MAYRRENELGELGKKALLEISNGLVLFELFVLDCTALRKQRMEAEEANMVIGVVLLPSVSEGAQRACEEIG